MSYTVLFREGNEIFSAPQYLNEQLEEHRTVLQLLVDELAATGHLQNWPAPFPPDGDPAFGEVGVYDRMHHNG